MSNEEFTSENQTDRKPPLGGFTERYQPDYDDEPPYSAEYADHVEWASRDNTIGQIDTSEMAEGDIQWLGVFTPARLRAWAELLEFAYGGIVPRMGGGDAGLPKGTVNVGYIEESNSPGGLLIAHPSKQPFSGSVTSVAGRVGRDGDNESHLFEDMTLPTEVDDAE